MAVFIAIPGYGVEFCQKSIGALKYILATLKQHLLRSPNRGDNEETQTDIQNTVTQTDIQKHKNRHPDFMTAVVKTVIFRKQNNVQPISLGEGNRNLISKSKVKFFSDKIF